MKKLLTLAFSVVAMASCSKEVFTDVDVIQNQGTSKATVNGIFLDISQQITIGHNDTYVIECDQGCKVNINGANYYESGVYQNDLKKQLKD